MEVTAEISQELVERLERIASILKIVSHPTRLGIVYLLEQYPKLSVSEFAKNWEVNNP